MTLHVAIDFGTSSTCTALSMPDGSGALGPEPQVVVVDGQPLVPSAVYAAPDGTLFVGHEAERQAAVDPSRYEPHPKRRVDEGDLLLATTVLPVLDAIRAVLSRAVGEARRVAAGAPVDLLVLTHPADWGAVRTKILRQAAAGLAAEVALVPEPVAAAVFHSAGHGMADGAALAVLDLGGGTVDASVVRRQRSPAPHHPGRVGGFEVLATRGDPTFGGADVDQALLEHVGALVAGTEPEAWQRLVEGRELADRRRRRVLRQDVRGAKETLSRHTYTDVPLPPPFPDAHVTRVDLEGLVAGPLGRAVDLVVATVREAGLSPPQLAGVFLVGGSSRIPLVSRLVHERTGLVPITLDQPETVVARGALRAVTRDPDRTAAIAPPPPVQPGPPAPRPPAFTPSTGIPATPPPVPPSGMGMPSPTLPPPARQKKSRAPFVFGGVVLALALVGGAIAIAFRSGGEEPRANAATKEIKQYDYSFTYPGDWEQNGGDANLRKVLVKPHDAAADTDVIAVQEFKLTYDSDADRRRALDELRGKYQQAGPGFTGFQEKASFAGRDVVYYRQQREGTTVDWYVLFQGDAQVSVGCQYTPAGQGRVAAACDTVVRTLKIS
ncbi:type VII secretion-associated protein [Longimycelium tulufanense]|uniref:Type VII secretion-associated protein n=1 Tax=Longimycelium tulufanense TaxID=907463 RepID=A0A8J3CF60_9PSEU|nr:type VII secretion-associated protein [Longimycelium tulufanense]GGM51552.1 type VII secretion-associated protein [Longimycelium tulufanense]